MNFQKNLELFCELTTRMLAWSERRDLLSLYVLFSQYMSCDNTLENRFFQISSYSRALWKDKGSSSLETSTGKTKYTSERG